MAKGGRINKIFVVIIFFLGCFFQALPVEAKEPTLPPHLIQSVSGEDIVKGMLALDLFHCPVLEEPDLETACENVRDTVVRIDMGKAYGSGVICWITADGAVIATNRHVLDYWREETGVIRFPQGYYAGASMLGSSETCDVGFCWWRRRRSVCRRFPGFAVLFQMRAFMAVCGLMRRFSVWGLAGRKMR